MESGTKPSKARKLVSMSLQARPIPHIAETTAKIARRAFRKGNVYVQMRDMLGTFFTDDQFTGLYPADERPATR
jgi:transposase